MVLVAQPGSTYGLEPLHTSIPGFDELELARCSRILKYLEKNTFGLGADNVVTGLEVRKKQLGVLGRDGDADMEGNGGSHVRSHGCTNRHC